MTSNTLSRNFISVSLAAVLLLCSLLVSAEPPKEKPSQEAVAFFESKVRPVLVENCYQCHAKANNMALGGFQLDTRPLLFKGGNGGRAVVPGKPEKSRLIEAVNYHNKNLLMPPKGKLSPSQIEALTTWVKMGAPWPVADSSKPTPSSNFSIKERKKHWSWQPVIPFAPNGRRKLPIVKTKNWARSPIDVFILSKLESEGMAQSPAADRSTLLRRVTFDLIGLPPTPEEIEAFLADKSPGAYEKVVDRLLASPRYGERWGRHWLDLVRFAETDGHEFDFDKPGAYQYRDYVIRALNADVPYNQFVREHVAGDLLTAPRLNPTDHFNESIIGTGFYWLGEGKHSPVELQADESERIDNQIDVFSKAFLGLSMGCARCHNHKFDAISTKDYYAIAGYMKSSRYQLAAIDSPDKSKQALSELINVSSELNSALMKEQVDSEQKSLNHLKNMLLAVSDGMITLKLASTPDSSAAENSWKKYLQETAAKDQNNAFYPWAALVESTRGKDSQTFHSERQKLVSILTATIEKARQDAKSNIVFADFVTDSYDNSNWFVTGEAFGNAPVKRSLLIADVKGTPKILEAMGPGVADSGTISGKLQGTLRSKSFVISKNFVWFHAAGSKSQIKLIIDGFQRIQDPIYGQLRINLNSSTTPIWHRMDVSKWVGHRAYVEALDMGTGSVALDKIVFSEGGAPPVTPNPLIIQMLDNPSVTDLNILAQRYQALFNASVKEWMDGSAVALDSANRSDLVNWMLHNQELLSPPAPNNGGEKQPAQIEITNLAAKKSELEKQIADPTRVLAMADGTAEDDRVHIRGSFKTLGDTVPRRFLEALAGEKQPVPKEGSGRLALADRMTDSRNPLVPRVIVNRLWQHHFGEGIVRSPDDFGVMGQPPTHPELLDWLASVFVEPLGAKSSPYACGWSMKKLHRIMVLSSTYRMSSRAGSPTAEEKDPLNKLLHRMPVRRLEAEAIRDSILAVSGSQDLKMYGPSVMPNLTDFMVGRGRPASSGNIDGDGRRSIYISVRRNFLSPMFLAFDYPVPFTTIGRRSVSNVPAQALALMNNPFVSQQAERWAKKTLAMPGKSTQEQINSLYLAAFARPASGREISEATDFIAIEDKNYGGVNNLKSWADLCHVLINVKEFIFVD